MAGPSLPPPFRRDVFVATLITALALVPPLLLFRRGCEKLLSSPSFELPSTSLSLDEEEAVRVSQFF